MPVTPAHAIVALPFASSRTWSAAAVASGAVAPDLPLLLSGGAGYGATHALWTVPTIDVLLGLGCLALWRAVLRPGLVAVLPAAARSRIPEPRRTPRALLPVAVAAGALTHVVCDAFTHAGRFGSAILPVLAERLGPFALTSWLQYASGAGGIAVLTACAAVAFRRAVPDPRRTRSPLGRLAAPVAGALVAGVLLAAIAAAIGRTDGSTAGALVAGTTAGLLAAGVGLALAGTAVRLIGRRSPGV